MAAGPLSCGAVPPRGGFPAEGWLFQEMAFACGSCYRNERLCPSAPAPERAKASREGRWRGAGVELGPPTPHPCPGRACGLTSPPGLCHGGNVGDLLVRGTQHAPTLRPPPCRPRGSRSPSPPRHHPLARSLLVLSCLQRPRAMPARPWCHPPRRGLLQRLQVQGGGLGFGVFLPLNSIFSTLRLSGGSRQRLLLRETSGFAVVANALILAPWKTLLRPALRFPATSERK